MSLLNVIALSCNRSGNLYVPPVAELTLREKLKDNSGGYTGSDLLTASMAYAPLAVAEPTLIHYPGEGIKMFHSTLNNNNLLCAVGIARSPDMDTPFVSDATPVLGRGYGGVDRNVQGAYWLLENGTTYLWATNGYSVNAGYGLDRKTYLYTSTDGGETYTDHGVCLDTYQPNYPEIIGYGNTGVLPGTVGGKHIMFVEALIQVGGVQNGWKMYRAEADSKMGPWTITHDISSQLAIINGGMNGGAAPFYSDGVIHLFYHAGPTLGYVPTEGAYAKSSDGGITWNTPNHWKKLTDNTQWVATGGNSPYPETDQYADFGWFEFNGKTYIYAAHGNNAQPSLSSKIVYWTFNGTKEQLVDLTPSN